ncbi:MAG: exo-alpha-sialidase, partial [Candidatus Eremiobacteraeota bacterium]|nr:exo-alpha-sialidase [Candidatus Eremiobacteraeota bacterium]
MAANAVRIASDPFANASSQHATQVEPDIASNGTTLVSAFQDGRFFVAGASGIGFSTSPNGGLTWSDGVLPGITRVQNPSNPFDTASDPSVAYDAAHAAWLIVSLPVLTNGGSIPAAVVSRSSDGLHWSGPIAVAPGQSSTDKTWITCDDTPASRFYGHCYIEWDDPSAGGLVKMSTSKDGGVSWSAPLQTADGVTGIGGVPVVQPGGNVVVPLNDFNQTLVRAFISTNGGASWNSAVTISTVTDHLVAGGLRTSPLPSAAVDGSGIVYVVWQDCRFRPR